MKIVVDYPTPAEEVEIVQRMDRQEATDLGPARARPPSPDPAVARGADVVANGDGVSFGAARPRDGASRRVAAGLVGRRRR